MNAFFDGHVLLSIQMNTTHVRPNISFIRYYIDSDEILFLSTHLHQILNFFFSFQLQKHLNTAVDILSKHLFPSDELCVPIEETFQREETWGVLFVCLVSLFRFELCRVSTLEVIVRVCAFFSNSLNSWMELIEKEKERRLWSKFAAEMDVFSRNSLWTRKSLINTALNVRLTFVEKEKGKRFFWTINTFVVDHFNLRVSKQFRRLLFAYSCHQK